MPNPLLSSYRTGENRVTGSTMAIFERMDLSLVREILAAATGAGTELRAVTFENQVVGDESTPDARISGHFSWWFETKTVRSGYAREGHDRKQVRLHSKRLDEADSLLFVLTPDAERPVWFDVLDGVEAKVRGRIMWLSFRDLADAMIRLIADPTRLISEQTRFLLSELITLYETDGLLSSDDTVIVAAREAWPEYQRFGIYVCQPRRSFRGGLTHFGFYAHGAVQPIIAHIGNRYIAVPFTHEEAARRRSNSETELADVIERLLEEGLRTEGESYDVLFLSAPDDPNTVRLRGEIKNDTVTAAGRPWGWTLSQRYTRLDKLTSGVTVTSQL